jgi:hypothetical protein
MNHHFEKAKFKSIVQYFLSNNCDMDLQL